MDGCGGLSHFMAELWLHVHNGLFYEANLYEVFAYLRKGSRFSPSDSWKEPLQTAWHKVAMRMEALLPS